MRFGFAGRVARAFLESKLTPLLILASLALGGLALIATPREEEPQIRVPMVDVMVAWPGAEPSAVASRLAEPIERAMWSLSRVEHVYSTARPGFALITVRFAVGEPYEPSLVKVYERLSSLSGRFPQGALPPAVELRTIDDVPFLTLTLWSEHGASDSLRPLAAELAQELSEIPLTSKAYLIGGQPRAVRVEPDPDRLAATGVTFSTLSGALRSAAARQDAGTMVRNNRETRVEAGPPFAAAGDVARMVVGVRNGRPIYVEDVARVIDGPAETTDAVFYAVGPARADATHPAGSEFPAVTIAVAKRPGANATALAEAVRRKVADLRPRLLPADVHLEFTRDYGLHLL